MRINVLAGLPLPPCDPGTQNRIVLIAKPDTFLQILHMKITVNAQYGTYGIDWRTRVGHLQIPDILLAV